MKVNSHFKEVQHPCCVPVIQATSIQKLLEHCAIEMPHLLICLYHHYAENHFYLRIKSITDNHATDIVIRWLRQTPVASFQ